MVKLFLKIFVPIINALNKTSIKRIVIYATLIYPLFFLYHYKDEISLILQKPQKAITIKDIPQAQERCYILRTKYNAEAVIVYAYQPIGVEKNYKERLIFSTKNFKPLESMRIVNLFTRTRIIESLKSKGYDLVTPKSKHNESVILQGNNLAFSIFTPIYDNNELIGEVVWIFDNETNIDEIDIQQLILEGNMFIYDFEI